LREGYEVIDLIVVCYLLLVLLVVGCWLLVVVYLVDIMRAALGTQHRADGSCRLTASMC
jgi:hypothetical protein